jgi:epoxide hydrolase-like predicted phosphatase
MNIIFDLGNVVLNWEPIKMISDIFPDMESREKIVTGLLKHADWGELDRGTLSYEKVIERAHKRTNVSQTKIRELLDEVPKSLTPKPETLELVRELKKHKHKLYVLSNMFSEAADYLENNYSFWDLFDGIVFSARIKLIKPSPEIYHYILRKFNLVPEETIFLDDLRDNVAAAIREGMIGIHLKTIEQVRAELREFIEI